uniref:Si:ch211-102l7.3 n=1 Tax=Echeneis naucrates TaxID=173247 RepID=A0A665TDH0_ECHNA
MLRKICYMDTFMQLLHFLHFNIPESLSGDNCPSSEWSVMCRPCCEYHLIQCRCPSKGSKVGYTVPCCRNALDQCDPCIYHPGCSLFENCKICHNGTWKANDDFFINGKYCTECRQGWSGGDCRICGGIIQRAQGHIALESYPTNARCEWTVQAQRGSSIELRFSRLSLEADHNCRYDYVEVRDGDSLGSPVIGRFCGDQPPPPIKSSGNFLHILFTSDGYNNFDGFVLTFQESSGIIVLGNVNVTRTLQSSGAVLSQTSRVHCTPPPKLLNGYHRPAVDTAGGSETIEFFCKNSYALSGNHLSTCLSNGSWSSGPPKCVRACREPKVSELVQQTVLKPHLSSREGPNQNHFSSRYSIQDVLSAGFIPFRRSSAGTDDISVDELPRGFHSVYTSIEYKCVSPLYSHKGSSRRTCLKTGRWSGHHVSCSPGESSKTQWPWHAAIYIRSPPDQESSFWYLACSGALLTQRSVLVAAQCVTHGDEQQPLHPAHVKVVIQQQTSKDSLKSQRHLRVSDIFVHPNSSVALQSNVAVLKLKDKAKISEHVLPACLPTTQGGEMTAQEAYTARWTLPNNPRHLGPYSALSQTKHVQLSDVAQCESELAQGETPSTEISDYTLCAFSRPSSPESPCPSIIPGLTFVQPGLSSTSDGWELLGLERFNHGETSCHQQTHTVQTRISSFRGWIEKNMK